MNKICRINAVLTEVGLPIRLRSIGNLRLSPPVPVYGPEVLPEGG